MMWLIFKAVMLLWSLHHREGYGTEEFGFLDSKVFEALAVV
jgi:hypothetical protein